MAVLVAMLAALTLTQQPPAPTPSPTPSPTASPSPTPTPSSNPLIDPKAPKVTLNLGEPTEKQWPFTGTADVADQVALQVSARRLERKWDTVAELFNEALSDQLRKQATGVVNGRAWKAMMNQAPVGFYKVMLVLKEEDMLLFEQRMALGRPDKLFSTSVDKVRKLIAIIEKSKAFMAEVIAIHKKEKPGTPAARQDYLDRVSGPEHELEDLYLETDLTGVIATLRSVYFHLRNAQVWNKVAGVDEGVYPDQGMFLNPDLTLGDMEKKIKSAPHVLSLELRLSMAGLLDELYERAGLDTKKLNKVRDAAKEALKLAAECPEKDEKFTKLLEKIPGAREEKEIGEIRAELKGVIDTLLRRY